MTPACFKNRQRILVSLVPVELCLGVMPTQVRGLVYSVFMIIIWCYYLYTYVLIYNCRIHNAIRLVYIIYYIILYYYIHTTYIHTCICHIQVVAEKYGLTELEELGRAATKGDIRTYNHIMDTYQRSFIKIGVYLVLEQVKHIVYRSLCKRIYNILGNTRVNLVSSILHMYSCILHLYLI